MSAVSSDTWHEAGETLDRAVAAGAVPGAVLSIGGLGIPDATLARGRLSYAPDSAGVRPDTIYDLASLTKVVVTTTMAMMLHEDGRFDLDEPVSRHLPAFRGGGKEGVRLWHLLSHSSGMAWWAPLFEELSGCAAYVARICEMPLDYEPGTKTVYSDFGFILLGAILEAVAQEPLDAFIRRRLFEPLGMGECAYRPPAAWRERIAPTEECAWRGRLIWGEVHDENACAMGGVAPHAGLFGTGPDLARFAHMLLAQGVAGKQRLLGEETIARFTRRVPVAGSTRALGWDTPNPEGYSTAGRLLSRRAFGHIGFTGTSLWIDPERALFVILLSNRVHPRRENEGIRALRPAVADAVVRALVAAGGRA